MLLLILLTDSDRPFNFVLPGDLILDPGEQENGMKLQAKKKLGCLYSFKLVTLPLPLKGVDKFVVNPLNVILS